MRALVLSFALAAAVSVVAPVAGAQPTPCDPMLLDWLCTVYQQTMRLVGRVCDAAVQGGCPAAHGAALLP